MAASPMSTSVWQEGGAIQAEWRLDDELPDDDRAKSFILDHRRKDAASDPHAWRRTADPVPYEAGNLAYEQTIAGLKEPDAEYQARLSLVDNDSGRVIASTPPKDVLKRDGPPAEGEGETTF